MSEPFRDDAGALGERVAQLEASNAGLRAEIARVRESVAPPSPLRRLRAPALVLALGLALAALNTARLVKVLRGPPAPALPHSTAVGSREEPTRVPRLASRAGPGS